jgi:sirohydrochlorin cobaltochelatase
MKAVVLFGHGSRDPLWRQPIERVAARIAVLKPEVLVACAYLELDEPDLATAVAELVDRGATTISVIPMFLGAGRHAREDLPKLVEAARARHDGVEFTLQPAVGEDPRVLDLLATIALE